MEVGAQRVARCEAASVYGILDRVMIDSGGEEEISDEASRGSQHWPWLVLKQDIVGWAVSAGEEVGCGALGRATIHAIMARATDAVGEGWRSVSRQWFGS